MADPLRDRILAAIAETIADIEEDGEPVFKRVARYSPVRQAQSKENRPAAFVRPLNERPADVRSQYEDMEERHLPVGIVLLGVASDFDDMDAELNRLAALVHKALEGNSLGGEIAFPLRWIGTDSPDANQSVPLDAIMPAYLAGYAHPRGDPYDGELS